MRSIGGFFSLELPHNTGGELYPEAIRLNSGRSCFEYILKARGYKKVWLPYYTCDVMLQSILKNGIDYEFYHIDKDFHIAGNVHVAKDEVLVYTDYFGLMDDYAREVAYEYSPNVILDNTQAFYTRPRKNTDVFNTCRKYFGVSDGAYLFTDTKLDIDIPQDHSRERMSAILDRLDYSPEEAFHEYHECEESLSTCGIRTMSKLTLRIMDSIDYNDVANRRLRNFYRLDKALSCTNEMHFLISCDTVPMVYPYYSHQKGLREHLIKNKIYVAKYWPNVTEWAGRDSFEADLTEFLLPLPIDQRYGEEEMDYIISTIINFQ